MRCESYSPQRKRNCARFLGGRCCRPSWIRRLRESRDYHVIARSGLCDEAIPPLQEEIALQRPLTMTGGRKSTRCGSVTPTVPACLAGGTRPRTGGRRGLGLSALMPSILDKLSCVCYS